MGIHCPAEYLQDLSQTREQGFLAGHDQAADDVAVPADELGQAVDDDVRAEVKGSLEDGGTESVIHDERQVVFPGQIRRGPDVR